MRNKTIGDQELALLQYIAEQGDASVGEVAAAFGESPAVCGEAGGGGRPAFCTRRDGWRARAPRDGNGVGGGVGVFRYSTTARQDDVVRNAVGSFVEKTLQGSVSPFVAWMSQRTEVSDNELAELEALVATLQSKRKEA